MLSHFLHIGNKQLNILGDVGCKTTLNPTKPQPNKPALKALSKYLGVRVPFEVSHKISDVLHLTTCARIVQQNTVLLSKRENTKKNYQAISTKLMSSPINSHYNIRGQQSISRLNTLNLLYLFSPMGRDLN